MCAEVDISLKLKAVKRHTLLCPLTDRTKPKVLDTALDFQIIRNFPKHLGKESIRQKDL